MPKVLISDKMSPKAAKTFEANNIEVDIKTGLSEDELCQIIGNYDGLAIRSSTTVTPKIIEHAKKLKVIGRAGIGVDNIDRKTATANGIVVMNTPFGNSITTAEHTIALILSSARKIPAANASTHDGKWEKSKFMGVEVANKFLGLIGCGNIGSIVADRAQGLKMKVIAYDPYLSEEKAKEQNIEKVSLDELLSRSDFITLHTPLNDSTRGILNSESLSKTKKGVRIVNCARGGLVNEEDLKQAILSGQVAGAAMDVFEKEPAKENTLFGLEEVICTPHLGASTSEAQENVAVQVAEQLSDYLNTGAVTNALNIPSVSSEDASKLSPYIDLSNKLGLFLGQILKGGIKSIHVEYEGDVAKLNTKPLTSVLLTGVLSQLAQSVNMVNAPIIASERGIKVTETKTDKSKNYHTLVRLTVDSDEGKQYISGSLFSGKYPRVVKISDVRLEASIESSMIYIENQDKPGLIGDLGKLLGDNDINIANFHLGRTDNADYSIALIEIDSSVDNQLLNKVKELPNVIDAKTLKF